MSTRTKTERACRICGRTIPAGDWHERGCHSTCLRLAEEAGVAPEPLPRGRKRGEYRYPSERGPR